MMLRRFSRLWQKKTVGNDSLVNIAKRNSFFFLTEEHLLSNDPFVQLYHEPSKTNLFILACSHWVDVDDFASINQSSLNVTHKFESLYEWIHALQPDSIFLDIDGTRLRDIDMWLCKNPQVTDDNDMTTQQSDNDDDYHHINETQFDMQNEMESYFGVTDNNGNNENSDNSKNRNNEKNKEKERNKKKDGKPALYGSDMKLSEKLREIDRIRHNQGLPIKKQTDEFLQTPKLVDSDLWILDLHWSLIDLYFSKMIPQYNQFKREYYLQVPKWRFLNLCFGTEIATALQYCRNNKTEMDKPIDLICGGIPIEMLVELIKQTEKPLNWIHFGVAIKNFFEDKQDQNMAKENAMIWDLFETAVVPQGQYMRRFGWDSTLDINEMLQDVVPSFYNVLYKKQREYVIDSLMQTLNNQAQKKDDTKTMVAIMGQSNVIKMLDQLDDNSKRHFKLFDHTASRVVVTL